MCLAEKGLDWESRHVDIFAFENYEPAYTALNPKAVVPTLDHEGKVLIGSNTILEYLEDVFPNDTPLRPQDPFARSTMDMIPRIREAARAAGQGQTVLLGGLTADNHDNLQALHRDAKLIVPLVLILILLVLIALLRCVVAPLYLIGTVILSFAFALGVSSLIFTHVFGQSGSDPNLAIFCFIFLVALGVDDNIFLMTRIREERRRGMSTRDAVIAGLERTGGVITSAGLILAGTFASLMALDLEALFQVGFTVALGLIVDAFLVRTFFVPSVALLLGERNWWPRRFV